MKAIISSSILIILLICGCDTKTHTDTIKKLNDSIINTFTNFQLHGDTFSLNRVLPLCDSVIDLDNGKHKYLHTITKYQILWALGRYEEALNEGSNAFDLLPPDNIMRLTFYGFKYKLLGDSLNSNKFYLQALSECEKQKANNVNAFIKEKTMILIYLGRINEAKETLQQANQNNPNDEEIKILLEDFDTIIDEQMELYDQASIIRIKNKE